MGAESKNNHNGHIPAGAMMENRRILIIDDERPILLTLEALLVRRGYPVETAAPAGLRMKPLKTKSAPLLLLDLQLPDADRLETLDQIKKEFPSVQDLILVAWI